MEPIQATKVSNVRTKNYTRIRNACFLLSVMLSSHRHKWSCPSSLSRFQSVNSSKPSDNSLRRERMFVKSFFGSCWRIPLCTVLTIQQQTSEYEAPPSCISPQICYSLYSCNCRHLPLSLDFCRQLGNGCLSARHPISKG